MRLIAAGLALGLLLCVAGCPKAPPLPADLVKAQQAERADNPERALVEYEAIVSACLKAPRSEPKDPCGTAAMRRAQALEQLGRLAEASDAYLQVRTVSTDGQNIARGLYRAATLYAGPLQQPAEALRLCREIISRWPAEVPAEDALKLLRELLTEANDPDLANELSRLSDALAGYDVIGSWALFYLAELHERAGQPGPALAVYDTLWRRFPRGPLFDDALWAAAQLLRKQKRAAEAAERLERLQATFTSAIIVGHYNKLLLDEGAILLGEIYLNDLGQPDRAINAWKGLLKRQKTSLLCDDALYLMAEAVLRRHKVATADDRNEACQYLGRLRREYPDGNRVRRAKELEARLRCIPGA